MISAGQSCYFVKQSNGTILNFFHINGVGIAYRVLRHNEWSKNRVLIRDAREYFAVAQLSNDDIYLIHEDAEGNIFLSMLNKRESSRVLVYKNEREGEYASYLGIVCSEEEIHLFYAVKNEIRENVMLFHQIADKNMDLSDISVIGSTGSDDTSAFNVHCSESGNVYIIYQRHKEEYILGYKVLENDADTWSKFFEIDRAEREFREYSVFDVNYSPHFIYLKEVGGKSHLIYGCGNQSGFKYQKLSEGVDINSCSIYRIKDNIWCTWLQHGKPYNKAAVINEFTFCDNPYKEEVGEGEILKVGFMNNEPEERKELSSDTLYIIQGKRPKYCSVYNLYECYRKEDNCSSYLKKWLMDLCQKYKEDSTDSSEDEENKRMVERRNKARELPELFAKLGDCIEELNDGIGSVKESFEHRDERIRELKGILAEKDDQILYLQNQIKSLKEHNGLRAAAEEEQSDEENEQ